MTGAGGTHQVPWKQVMETPQGVTEQEERTSTEQCSRPNLTNINLNPRGPRDPHLESQRNLRPGTRDPTAQGQAQTHNPKLSRGMPGCSESCDARWTADAHRAVSAGETVA